MLPTRDLRIESFRPLLPPAILLEELPLTRARLGHRRRGRDDVGRILRGEDDRLLVVVGPCSIHDPAAALDYARRLRALARRARGATCCIVMRVYFEKPRTTVGWKGLINDPHLDGSFAINEGLRAARAGCCSISPSSGCRPAASSSIRSRRSSSPTSSPGARSARAPPRARCTASWRRASRCRSASRTAPTATCRSPSTPIRAAAHPHRFLGVTEQGLSRDRRHARAIRDCHLILRGGAERPELRRGERRRALAGAARRRARRRG